MKRRVLVAGLAVRAKDTGRVLMLQRALSGGDPAAGMWEFPGGHIEGGERPLQAAKREWREETGAALPSGKVVSGWTSGIYKCYVWEISSESQVKINYPVGGRKHINPDDPDGDWTEVVAWWSPALMKANPALRAELRSDMSKVQKAIRTLAWKEAAFPITQRLRAEVAKRAEKPNLKSRAGRQKAADELLDMDSASGMLADYLAPSLWGGERAGRAEVMGRAAGTAVPFSVAHPMSTSLAAVLGGEVLGAGLGGLAGAGISQLMGADADTTTNNIIASAIGGTVLGISGAIGLSGAYRRYKMRQLRKAFVERGQAPKTPQLSNASALLLPYRGPHRLGQQGAARYLRGEDPQFRNTMNDLAYAAPVGLGAVPGVGVASDYLANALSHARQSGVKI